MSTVYLNGDYLAVENAKVSVLDRGFLFGDGVYEVIPVYNGHLFRLDQHLHRLQTSLDNIRLASPYSSTQWRDILTQLIEKNGGGDQAIYLQLTRGVAPRDHAFPQGIPPTVFAMANPLKSLAEEIAENGVAAITIEDNRWLQCHIKAISLLPNVLLRQQAVDSGVSEAILYKDGFITEGSASNVFIVDSNGIVVTPPKGTKLLPGITRDLVLELAEQNDIANAERTIEMDELSSVQEIWLTSSTKEILPVTRINDKAVGSGKPGPVWRQMIEIYRQYKKNFQG
ncbi:MAG: D-amino acid aminotransferase [Gammaproteobacteria bacterium]|nr:D-amino acid aminotransferase [Gammaproteobacteria bacterium]MDH5692296.1 D-amino acid aminotransferase [Gammaproteobacteria bacterium]